MVYLLENKTKSCPPRKNLPEIYHHWHGDCQLELKGCSSKRPRYHHVGACDPDQYVLPINASASVCWSDSRATDLEQVA